MSSFWDDVANKAGSAISMSNVGDYLVKQVLGGPQLVKKPAQSQGGNLGNPVQTAPTTMASENQKSFIEQYGIWIAVGFAGLLGIILIARK